MQKSWKHCRSRCVDDVLSGAWDADIADISAEQFRTFWEPLLTTPSVPDSREPEPLRECQWLAMMPVSKTEVQEAIRGMAVGTSPGPDGRRLEEIKGLPPEALTCRFNLWLYSSCLPSPLCEGYTSLIPKVPGTKDPAEHRPITVGSVLARLYHKVIAKRLETLCPPDERQKAFRSGDGIAENLELLKAMLKTAQDSRHPRSLYLAFLDVRKAFDSVSHESLLLAAKRAGIPLPLLVYIKDYYSRSTTRLKAGGAFSPPISVLQGVKQGCPLSCILFNLVIDWALSTLDKSVGFQLAGERVNHLAFADDCMLAASTPAGLQHQVRVFTEHLAKSGLSVNAGKCASLVISVNGKTRKWVCDPNPVVEVFGERVKPLTITQTYKYLGLQVNARGARSAAESKIKEKLAKISKAPLKPQQRLWILRQNVYSAIIHDLTFSSVSRGFLSNLDKIVRQVVRSWAKLPKDTVTPFFYARVEDGGLGLVQLEHMVPERKRVRLTNLQSSRDRVVRAASQIDSIRNQIEKWSTPKEWCGHLMSTKELRNAAYADELYKTVDGKGLRHASLVPQVHQWVSNGASLLTGSKFCAALGVRASTLPTKLRGSRGRPGAVRECGCGRLDRNGARTLESLGHIVQECYYTHDAIVKRHNRVLEQAAKIFRAKGYKTLLEHPFKIAGGAVRKPDLVVYGEGRRTTIFDVCIVSDMYDDLNTPLRQKVEKYSQHEEITEACEQLTGRPPDFSAIAINWRGCMAPQTAVDLKLEGFTSSDLLLLSAITVEQSAIIHRIHHLLR